MTKRTKPEIWWCIEADGILLPYTARTTRRQAIAQYIIGVERRFYRYLGDWERAEKLEVRRVPKHQRREP